VPRPAPGQTQHEMHVAADEDARAASAEVARLRADVSRYLDEESERELAACDRAFEAYRDAETEFAAGQFRGGSLAPTEACAARAGVTWDRARRLRALLSFLRETHARR
jgi:uncharacterized protein YecT (DUF1311 family)